MIPKTALLAAIAATNRGLLASEDDRLMIQARASQLEEAMPAVNPLDAAGPLAGIWQLLYTTSRELLGIDRFPLYKLGQIYQCINLSEQRVYNIAEITGPPLLEGLVSVAARFEAASDKRVTVGFERGVFGLQRLLGYETPHQWLQKLQAEAKLPLWQGIDFQINRDRQSGWLEVTYLDDDLRIGRGNQGSLFVLKKVIPD